MEIATWILVIILSITLLIFLVVGIVLITKLIDLTEEAKEVVIKSQEIADKTGDVVENVNGMTSIGGVVKTFAERYNKVNGKRKSKK